ncbi:thioredoxin family protein [Bacillus sp. FJAT-47783]|uniref:thioredoxin family protein n=1 Tax=Bacillus sp. FJAT-47783 TaxID=2922712 RepID=UPI001FAE4925|nr:thioredoxin family protein [Bacillus sp. FJAT-47783]
MVELSEQQLQNIENEEQFILYLYTPLCGTCQLAKKMLTVVDTAIPSLNIFMKDLNYIPTYAEKWEIESVPCLLVFQKGEIIMKKYAFHSIEHLYETLKAYAA